MTITLQGAEEIARALKKLAKAYPAATAQAIYAEGFAIQAEAQKRCPVEFGVLRSSAYTAPPTPEDISTEVGFGTRYAVPQHERTEFRHPRGGEAKYLENAVNARTAGMVERLGQRVAAIIDSGQTPGPVQPLGPTAPVVTPSSRRRRRRGR